jgi:hypothetical protein
LPSNNIILFTYKYVVIPHTKGGEISGEKKIKKILIHTLPTPTQHKNLKPIIPRLATSQTRGKEKVKN